MSVKRSTQCCVLCVCFALLFAAGARGGGTVTNATDAALRTALAGGGQVLFTNDALIQLAKSLVITNDTVIDAQGHSVTISGSNAVQVFDIGPNSFTALNLTITGGHATTGGGALYIRDGATVTLNLCTLSGNSAPGLNGVPGYDGADDSSGSGGDGTDGGPGKAGLGGAIYNLGSLTLNNCKLLTNSVTGGNGGTGGKGGDGRLNGGDGGTGSWGGSGYGGAIYNIGTGSVSATDCTFAGNSAKGGSGGEGGLGGSGELPGLAGDGGVGAAAAGAAIYSSSSVTVLNCTFADNVGRAGNSAAGGDSKTDGTPGLRGPDAAGGAIALVSGGTCIVTNSTFAGNKVFGGGGGDGGNGQFQAGDGGDGGNGTGGGIYNGGSSTVVNCTFGGCGAYGGTNGVAGTGPFAGSPGALGLARGGEIARVGGTFVLKNTILGASTSGANAFGTISDQGNNVTSDATPTTAQFRRTDPKLGPLTTNGGPTLTMMLLAGSVAVGHGDNTWAPPFDQRGFPRPLAEPSDIGSVEGTFAGILTEPVDQFVTNGGTARFSVTAAGVGPFVYQWYSNTVANASTNYVIPGATNSTLTLTNVTPASEGYYSVAVSNAYGGMQSRSAKLTVGTGPSITQQPADQTVLAGASAAFSVVATGSQPLTFQWRLYGTNLAGGTQSSFTIGNVQTNNTGPYSVIVSNAFATVTSASAMLKISPALTVSSPVMISTNVAFSFQAQTGFTYVTEFKNTLSATNWVPLVTNIPITVQTITNIEPATNIPGRFYRVRVQ